MLAFLLECKQPVTRIEILSEIPGYAGDNDAGRRAFERDKEMLRSMGVPIKVLAGTGSSDQAYTVDPNEYFLPDLDLTDSETAALRVAVNAVSLGSGIGDGALLKLGSAPVSGTSPIASLPLLPQLAPLFDGFRKRLRVFFTYQSTQRRVQPWNLSSRGGRWYLVGFDCDREAVRTFRVDRIANDVKLDHSRTFEVPDDFRPEEFHVDQPWHFGSEHTEVRILVDADCISEVDAALGTETDRAEADGSAVVLTIDVSNPTALRSRLFEFEDRIEILSPESFRADTIAWLEDVVARGHGSA